MGLTAGVRTTRNSALAATRSRIIARIFRCSRFVTREARDETVRVSKGPHNTQSAPTDPHRRPRQRPGRETAICFSASFPHSEAHRDPASAFGTSRVFETHASACSRIPALTRRAQQPVPMSQKADMNNERLARQAEPLGSPPAAGHLKTAIHETRHSTRPTAATQAGVPRGCVTSEGRNCRATILRYGSDRQLAPYNQQH